MKKGAWDTECSSKLVNRARELLINFKGDSYAFGTGVIDKVGEFAEKLGEKAMVIANDNYRSRMIIDLVAKSLQKRAMQLGPMSINNTT
jgi:hypothetical protein